MSRRRLLGWEPVEEHAGYDAAGDPAPIGQAVRVVVTREPEWDDDERNRLLALGEYEAGVGPCGYHHSLTVDPANFFAPHVEECPVCAAGARYMRVLAERDESARADLRSRFRGKPPADAPDPADGRRVFMRRLSPGEVAAQRAREEVR